MSVDEVLEAKAAASLNWKEIASGDVKKYINNVSKWLKMKYGEVNPTWQLILSMLAETLEAYFELKEDIVKRGRILKTGRFAGKANPACKMATDCLVRIEHCIDELGLSPKAEQKLQKKAEDDDYGQKSFDFLIGQTEPARIRVVG